MGLHEVVLLGSDTANTPWERIRDNEEATPLASAVRSATTNGPDQTNFNAKGIAVFFDIAVVPGTDTVQLVVQGKDPATGAYVDFFVDAAQVAVAKRTVIIYPNAGAAADGVDATRAYPIPRTFRIRIVHVGVGSFTYSVGMSFIN